MQRNKIIATLSDPSWHKVIHAYAGKRIDPLSFRKEHGNSEAVLALIEILHLYHKAKVKLPTWVEAFAAMDARSYEQSSSEETAEFKSSLIPGNRVLNLSGGLGVDDVALSHHFNEVVSVELDPDVHAMASYNMEQMGVGNVQRLCMSAEEYLDQCTSHFDLIYIDPDRRPQSNTKVADLRECDPCVPDLEQQMFAVSDRIMTKLSPMYDLHELKRVLNDISHIYVVSVRNEVKEVLSIQTKGYSREPLIIAVDIDSDGNRVQLSSDRSSTAFSSSETGDFLYESGSAVVKAGLGSMQQQIFSLEPLSERSPFYLGKALEYPFLGRTYRVLWRMELKWDHLKKELKKQGWTRASVTSKDFYMKPREILRKLKMDDGGETQLIFTKDASQRPVVFAAERIS